MSNNEITRLQEKISLYEWYMEEVAQLDVRLKQKLSAL